MWAEFILILETTVFILKIISAIVSIIMLVLIVWLIKETNFYESKIKKIFFTYKEAKSKEAKSSELEIKNNEFKKFIQEKWAEIKAQSEKGDMVHWKLSIIEADKLVDTVLKELGFIGNTMGERLKTVTEKDLPSINSLWQVHNLRNNLVHTSDFNINKSQAEKAISIFEKALKEFKVIGN